MFFHYFWQSTFLVSALWKCIIYIYSNFQKINLVICFKNYVSLQPIKTYVKFSSHIFQSFIKNEIISMKKKKLFRRIFEGDFLCVIFHRNHPSKCLVRFYHFTDRSYLYALFTIYDGGGFQLCRKFMCHEMNAPAAISSYLLATIEACI